MSTELSRRGFLVLSAGALATLSGTAAAADIEDLDDSVQGTAVLIGPEANRPDPGGDWFDQWDGGPNHVYLTRDFDAGDKQVGGKRFFYIDGVTDDWVQLPTHLVGYPEAELPASPLDGSLFFDENRDTPVWWDGDNYEWPSFVDDVLTTPQTVANTATRTEVYNVDIDAGSLIKGRIYQFDLMGKFSTANTADQFTVFLDLAGTDIISLQNEPAKTTDAPWSVEGTYTVREQGVSGVVKTHSKGIFDDQPRSEDVPAVTFDTTTVTNLSVDIKWDAAEPGNSVTLEQAHLKQMG